MREAGTIAPRTLLSWRALYIAFFVLLAAVPLLTVPLTAYADDHPSVAITAPTTSTTYLPSAYIALCAELTSEICGTASDDTSLTGVEAQVKWNDGIQDLWLLAGAFNPSETWNDVTGSLDAGAWSLAFNPATATNEGTGDDWIGYVSESFVTKARATDEANNVVETLNVSFTVAKAAVTLAYTGTNYDSNDDGQLVMSAQVTSTTAACQNGVVVRFFIDNDPADDGGGNNTDTTDGSGVATLTAIGVTTGIKEVRVEVDESLDCLPPVDGQSVVSVTAPGDSANGGGWYQNFYVGGDSPRINFGFTVKRDCGGSGQAACPQDPLETPYKGQFLAINNEQWRLKGTVDSFGNTECPAITGLIACGSVRGAGKLYSWDAGLLDWVFEDDVTFTAGFYDGGSARKGGSAKPDYAGILTITGYSGGDALPTSLPLQLKGGNVTLSDEPLTTTTSSGGGKKSR